MKAAVLTIFISSVICLALFVPQPSQPPSPTPREAAQAKQNKTAPKERKTAPDDNATDRLAASINKLTSEVAAWNQKQANTQSKNSPSFNDAKVTDWIVAFFTGILALLAWFQYRSMKKQADYMRRGLGISINQARIANKSAIAAKESAEAATAGANVARDALVLAHQPYLDVKGFKLLDLNTNTAFSPMLQISCKIFNPSQTRANVSLVEPFGNVQFDKDMLITVANGTQVAIYPGRGYWFPITFKQLTPIQADCYGFKQLIIDMRLRVTFTDPFGNEIIQLFDRVCMCGPSGYIRVSLQTNSPFDPWPPEVKKD